MINKDNEISESEINNDKISLLRQNMVKEQIIARGIIDKQTLNVLKKIPRHLFVPQELIDNAYEDHPLPIGYGQTISQPYIVALMTESLNLRANDKVLELGTGSGYRTSILAEMSKEVHTVERIKELSEKAKQLLSELGYKNIFFYNQDGSCGLPEYTLFDAIIVTASVPEIVPLLLEQLSIGGRMVIPAGDRQSQQLLLIIKTSETDTSTKQLCSCAFVPLIGKYAWDEKR